MKISIIFSGDNNHKNKLTLIIKVWGELFVFGYNQNGQLGSNNKVDKIKPILLMKDLSIRYIVYGGFYSLVSKETNCYC